MRDTTRSKSLNFTAAMRLWAFAATIAFGMAWGGFGALAAQDALAAQNERAQKDAQPQFGERSADRSDAPRERMRRNRERWRRLTPERRAELKKIHDALAQLDPEKRAQLEQRLRELGPQRAGALLRKREECFRSPERDELRQRVRALGDFRRGLSPEDRAHLRSLPPEEFRQFIEKRMETVLGEFRAKLSPEEQVEFDSLDRREKFDRLRRAHHQRMFERYRSQLSEEERARFDAMERKDQHREMREQMRRNHGPRGAGDGPRGRRGGRPGEDSRGRRGDASGEGSSGGRRSGGWGPGDRPAPPPPPAWLDPHLEEVRALPRGVFRAYLRDGTLPEGVELSPELRSTIEGLSSEEREQFRMPRRRQNDALPRQRRSPNSIEQSASRPPGS